jgi:hypothetical protein
VIGKFASFDEKLQFGQWLEEKALGGMARGNWHRHKLGMGLNEKGGENAIRWNSYDYDQPILSTVVPSGKDSANRRQIWPCSRWKSRGKEKVARSAPDGFSHNKAPLKVLGWMICIC